MRSSKRLPYLCLPDRHRGCCNGSEYVAGARGPQGEDGFVERDVGGSGRERECWAALVEIVVLVFDGLDAGGQGSYWCHRSEGDSGRRRP